MVRMTEGGGKWPGVRGATDRRADHTRDVEGDGRIEECG